MKTILVFESVAYSWVCPNCGAYHSDSSIEFGIAWECGECKKKFIRVKGGRR